MNKQYVYLTLFALFFSVLSAQSQILIIEDFEEGIPDDWAEVGFLPGSDNPCEGNQSIRRNFTTDATNGTLTTSSMEATGEDIEVSFEYKIIDVDTGNPIDNSLDFGTMNLEYSIDGGNTWTTDASGTGDIIDNTVYSDPGNTDCITHTYTITGVSDEDEFAWRFDGDWNDGDYQFYLDNLSIVEQVGCIQPYNVSIGNISFDEAEISWEDLNGTPDEWTIEYLNVGSGFTPGGGLGTEETATATSITLDGLDDGQEYTFYIQTVCDSATEVESVWEGPYTFQTIAIGTDCDVPIEVNADSNNPDPSDLPYNDSSETEIYANDYSGLAGAACNDSGNLLNGYDVVYHYIPDQDNILTIEVTDFTIDNVGVFVYQSCDNIGEICVGGDSTDAGEDLEANSIFVDEGEEYYIIVASTDGTNFPENTTYSIHIKGFDCSSWEMPDGNSNIEFVDGQTLNEYSETPSGANPTINGATLTWYEDAALTIPIADPSTINLSGTDTYWVTQTIGNCESDELEITFNEFDCQNELEITNTTDATGTDGACGSGSLELTAESSGDPEHVYWYSQETGGDIIHIGENFTTPEIDETTSYWVSEVFLAEGLKTGEACLGPSEIYSSVSTDYGVAFSLTGGVTIESVQVFVTGESGTLQYTISGTDNDGTVIEENYSMTVPGGTSDAPTAVTVPVETFFPAGNYEIIKTSGPSMLYESSTNTDFPYAIGNSGEVTSGAYTWGTLTTYYYFFNWTIREELPLCESERVEVIATVHEIYDVEISAAEDTVCLGTQTTLTADSENDDYEYVLEWDNGNESENFDPDNTIAIEPDENTTYTIIATDPTTGCSTENEISIEVIDVPDELTITPTTTDVCVGESIPLTAGGIYEDFEDTTNNWETEDNSSGPEAVWSLQQSPIADIGTTSNDNSQFYFTNADLLGEGGTVDVELISTDFSLASVEEASLQFYHQYRHHSSTAAEVDISTDNGSTWQNLTSFSTTQGTATEFSFADIDISDYVGYSTVKIRFHFSGGWGWWWAIDNVTINREYIGEVTWSPTTDLFLDPQATIPYEGAVSNTVYYFSEQENQTTYTAELEVADCGSISEDVSINTQLTNPPNAESPQSFDEGATIGNIEAEGDNLTWYADEEGTQNLTESTELEDEETYYVSQTVNGCESELTAITITINDSEPECAVVSELTVEYVDATSAIITWTEPENADNIDVYYYEVLHEDEVIYEGEILTGTSLIDIAELTPETEYTYIIYTICETLQEEFIYSDTNQLSFETTELSLASINFSDLNYYPNPTSDRLTISNQIPIDHIEVYNLLGQKVLSQDTNGALTTHIDFSKLSSGAYLTKITAGGAEKFVKIIKK